MSNPTSNFGWQMPTPTDLVTDLPADFEVFGQAVDTSMADLKGGTTGQILSKATNADMDFTWIANDQGDITAVNVTSPITGGGTAGAVTVGIQSASTSQSGAVQLSDSTSTTSSILASTPTATKAAYDLANAAVPRSSFGAAGKNGCLNGGFDIWQRGTTFTVGAAFPYTADRWQVIRSGVVAGMTVTRQATGDTTNLPNIQYCARIQRDAGNTSTAYLDITQSFESNQAIPFAGQTITLSFYARAGANYSSASGALNYRMETGTGTDQNVVTAGYTGAANLINATATLTTTWQRFTRTATVSSTATEFALRFRSTPVGTAGADDYFEITGVQIEIGSSVSSFSRNASSIQGELAACQRYYFRQNVGTSTGFISAFSPAWGANNVDTIHPFPVPMRVTPTAIDYSSITANDNVNALSTPTSVANNCQNQFFGDVRFTFTGSPLTQYRNYAACGNANASAYVGFTAEL